MDPQVQYSAAKAYDAHIWRDKFAFFLIGFQNRCGFILLIVAAKDILKIMFPKENNSRKTRLSNEITTGLVLILAHAPALLCVWVLPYLPKRMNFFVTLSILLSTAGYLFLAFGVSLYLPLAGVLLISMGYGIGELKLSIIRSGYPHKSSKFFEFGVINAEFFAAFFYTLLRVFKINLTYIFLGFLLFPVLGVFGFWILLRQPRKSINDMSALTFFNLEPKTMTCDEQLQYTCYIMKYIMPLSCMSFLRGVINQGLYEFIYYYGNFVGVEEQYSVFICSFALGNYACMVTRNLLQTRHVSICVLIQTLIACVFLVDALFGFMGYIWITTLLAYLEGIVHGVAYNSGMDKMLENESSEFLHIAKAIIRRSLFIASILSGAFDFAVHYCIAESREPKRP